jgi:hypothetical protein
MSQRMFGRGCARFSARAGKMLVRINAKMKTVMGKILCKVVRFIFGNWAREI